MVVLLAADETLEVYAWIDPDGIEHPWTLAAGMVPLQGISGRWQAALDLSERVVMAQPGSRVSAAWRKSTDVFIPLHIFGDTYGEVHGLLDNLALWLNTTTAPGKLRVQRPDGSQREIVCYAQYRVNESASEGIGNWRDVGIVLYCPEPIWYDVDDQTADSPYVASGSAVAFLGDPFLPLRLSSSAVLTSATISNSGHEVAWPVWTVTGPGSNLALRNLTTGKAVELTNNGGLTLGIGEQVVIDTRPDPTSTNPFAKSVTDGLGTNLFQSLSQTSDLWGLARGSNLVQIELTNATAASSVDLSYKRRFLGP